jgi:hypothetical protein
MPAEHQKSACSAPAGLPEEAACPKCGEEIECWSDEQECTCSECGAVIQKGHLPVACGVL